MKQTIALKIANVIEDGLVLIYIFTFMPLMMVGGILVLNSNNFAPFVLCFLSAGLIVGSCMVIEKILVIHYKFEIGIYEGYALQGEGLN